METFKKNSYHYKKTETFKILIQNILKYIIITNNWTIIACNNTDHVGALFLFTLVKTLGKHVVGLKLKEGVTADLHIEVRADHEIVEQKEHQITEEQEG